MKSKIFIVLPVFNRLDFTKKCLSSIFNQTYKKYKLIIIDDGSTDNTLRYVTDKFPKVQIIKGDGDWWWTRSMYEGVVEALKTANNKDYILEMNNDLYFDKNYLQQIIDTSKKYQKTVVGTLCIRSEPPHEVVEAGIRIDWSTGLVYSVAETISKKLSYYKNMDVIKDLDALPGKGTLIPVNVFKKAGNFDFRRLPHYIADYEFSIRAKKAGYNLIVDTKAIAKHHWEATGIYSNSTKNMISYKRAYNLLLGRKSMNNIVDWIVFLFLACPRKYLLRNLYFSIFKVLKAIFTIFPFLFKKTNQICLYKPPKDLLSF